MQIDYDLGMRVGILDEFWHEEAPNLTERGFLERRDRLLGVALDDDQAGKPADDRVDDPTGQRPKPLREGLVAAKRVRVGEVEDADDP